MKLAVLIAVMLFVGSFCFGQNNYYTISMNDTNKIVGIVANLDKIETIKSEYGNKDDFFTVVDGNNYYFYLANQYLEQNSIKCDYIDDSYIILIDELNLKFLISDDILSGFFIYQARDKGEFVYDIDIPDFGEYKNYEWIKKYK